MRRPSSSTNITTHHGDPVPGSFYGRHLGTDYATPLNTVIVAPTGGRIATQGWSDSVGNYIEIDGNDGRRHRLLHLNQRQIANGANVSEGQQVGLSGSTGSSSTGPHIHWDARKGGTGFGDGFANYVDTEKLVTPQPAPAPGGAPKVDASVVGRTLHLKPVDRWRVYALNVTPKVGNEKAFLRPAAFGGLDYKILAVTQWPQVVTIQTQDFGKVNIYVDSDAEIR